MLFPNFFIEKQKKNCNKYLINLLNDYYILVIFNNNYNLSMATSFFPLTELKLRILYNVNVFVKGVSRIQIRVRGPAGKS